MKRLIYPANSDSRDPHRRHLGMGLTPAMGLLASMLCGLMPLSVLAQGLDPVPVRVGDSRLYPDIRVDYITNDNAFLTRTEKTDSTALLVAPALSWVATQKTLTLEASYRGLFGQYSESPLDFDDHALSFRASSGLTKKLSGSVSLGLERNHEELGTNLTLGNAGTYDEQVTYNDSNLTGRLTYGSEGAKGNLEGGLTIASHTPTSLKSITKQTEYKLVRPFAGFSLRVSPDTRLVTELRFSSYDYTIDERDRTDVEVLVGASFAPTGKLSGTLLLGAGTTSYDTGDREDSSEFVASTRLTYRPVNYARFDLQFIRDFDNTDASPLGFSGTQSVRDLIQVAWRHRWSSRVSHIATVRRTAFERDCPSASEASDLVSLEGNVIVKRWLEVGASISQSARTYDACEGSTVEDGAFDYDRQIIGVHFKATL